jgi:hypothetical protein
MPAAADGSPSTPHAPAAKQQRRSSGEAAGCGLSDRTAVIRPPTVEEPQNPRTQSPSPRVSPTQSPARRPASLLAYSGQRSLLSP